MLEDIKAAEYLVRLNFAHLSRQNPKPPGVSDKEYYAQIFTAAEMGPIFNSKLIEQVRAIQNKLSKPETKFVANNLPKYKEEVLRQLVYILDWSRRENVDISQYTFEKALAASQQWHSQFKVEKTGEYETKKVVMQFPDGYSWVKVDTKHDLETEGKLMGHCAGEYYESVQHGYKVYSLRDPQNRPHVTIGILPDGQLEQIRGKENKKPNKKYHPYISHFLFKLYGDNILEQDLELVLSYMERSYIQELIIRSNNLRMAYLFARSVKDANIQALQNMIIKSNNAHLAHLFARYVKGADIQALRKIYEGRV